MAKYYEWRRVVFIFVLSILFFSHAWAATLSFANNGSHIFSEQAVELQLNSIPLLKLQRVDWRVSLEGVTVDRGSISLTGADKGGIQFKAPRVKAGLTCEIVVEAHAYTTGLGEPVTSCIKSFHVFARDPLIQCRHLKGAIHLFDPSGKTRSKFEELGIPFEQIIRASAVSTIEEGLLIIGEGVSYRSCRGFFDQLVERADVGVSVLCLAPEDGVVDIPGLTESERERPVSFNLSEGIDGLECQLGFDLWGQGIYPVKSRMAVKCSRGRIFGEFVASQEKGWPWVQIKSGGGGTLSICGFGLMEYWDDSPEPRYILKALLEREIYDEN